MKQPMTVLMKFADTSVTPQKSLPCEPSLFGFEMRVVIHHKYVNSFHCSAPNGNVYCSFPNMRGSVALQRST